MLAASYDNWHLAESDSRYETAASFWERILVCLYVFRVEFARRRSLLLPSTNGDRRYRRDPLALLLLPLLPIDPRYLYLPLSNLFPYSLSFLFDFAIDVYDATILLFFLLLLLPFFFPPLLRDAVTKGRHLKPCFKEGKKATRIKIDGDKGFDGF